MSEQPIPQYSYLIRYGVPLAEGWSRRMERPPVELVDLPDLLAHFEGKKSALDREVIALENALRLAHVERVVVAKKIEVLTGLNVDVAAIRQAPWDHRLVSAMSSNEGVPEASAAFAAPEEPGRHEAPPQMLFPASPPILTEVYPMPARRPVGRYVGVALAVAVVTAVGGGMVMYHMCSSHKTCSTRMVHASR